jgi:hypothetical protein
MSRGVHRLVKQFYSLLPQDTTLPKFCEYHGLNVNTVRSWRRKANPISPQVEVFDDILNRMGYRLTIEKKETL